MSEVRIIGGDWRSRRIEFQSLKDLRPTPGRVRETLFNWLQSHIAGAKCLELFAGSGVLSMEALSRGAAHCTVIDHASAAIQSIRNNLQRLDAAGDLYHCEVSEALPWLENYSGPPFDVIFLDPPFSDNQAVDLLEQCSECLTEDGFIYVETPFALSGEALPKGYSLHRQKKAGAVHFALLRQA